MSVLQLGRGKIAPAIAPKRVGCPIPLMAVHLADLNRRGQSVVDLDLLRLRAGAPGTRWRRCLVWFGVLDCL